MIVRDDDDPGLALLGDLGEKFHDLPSSRAVERGGGFIGRNEAAGSGFPGKGLCGVTFTT